MAHSLPLLMVGTAAALTACSTEKSAAAPKPAAGTSAERKITPSPWQPPAEVDPPHKDPGDRVDPGGAPPVPPEKSPPPPGRKGDAAGL